MWNLLADSKLQNNCGEEPGYVQQGHLDDPDQDQPILNVSLLSVQTDFIMKVKNC